eukprot:765630-Hanusia_phi.AAC.4
MLSALSRLGLSNSRRASLILIESDPHDQSRLKLRSRASNNLPSRLHIPATQHYRVRTQFTGFLPSRSPKASEFSSWEESYH